MRVVQTISSLDRAQGGPSVVVPELVQQMVQRGVSTDVVCQTRAESPPAVPDAWGRYHFVRTIDRSRFGYSGELKPLVSKLAHAADVIHSHGLWMHVHQVSSNVARRSNRPHVISTHGMLEPWAFRFRRWKKEIAWRLFQSSAVRGAACIHALTQGEANNLRALGFRNPIAIVPNGVRLPHVRASRDVLENRFAELRATEWVLFHSRIHPKKGLLPLAYAWSSIFDCYPNHRLVIAGPDELEHWAEVRQVLERSRAPYTYTGMLSGEARACALSNADVFVLPSYSEGFSMAVLEALAYSRPTILTRQCNFPEVEASGAGITCEPDAVSIAGALRRMLDMSSVERSCLGANGRHLAETQYSWERVGDKMYALYRWLCGEACTGNEFAN